MAARFVHNQEKILRAYEELGGNVSATARKMKCSRDTVQRAVRALGAGKKPLVAGQAQATVVEVLGAPKAGHRVYLLTCAQNNTHVHPQVWDNFMAIARHRGAKVFCSSFTYNQNAFGKLSVKRGTSHPRQSDLWYDPKVIPFLEESDRDIELAPGLVWCGRMNTLPTASRPLQGFETYTGRRSGILPHAKLAMASVASGKYEATKFNYTTGTITQRNYIQKREGLRAEKQHSYGGLIVEATPRGWYVRQLSGDDKGSICDLDIIAENGRVRSAPVVEDITWGDIHVTHLDPMVRRLAWEEGGILDALRPNSQHFHDILTFQPRSHWDVKDPHKMFLRWVEQTESVRSECVQVRDFLHLVQRRWCKNWVVDSNHDEMLERWLREADYRRDPVNARFFLKLQERKYQALEERDEKFHLLEWVLRELGAPEDTTFLREDESHVICRGTSMPDGIETGMHGHLGINGMRGSPRQFARMGRAANTCHTHSAGIEDDVYTGGTSSLLRLEYMHGPSSHSHSFIVTYKNGRRAIVTMWNEGYRA